MKRKKESFSPPAVGATALLVAFAILCLTVFALLSLSTVRAERRLSDEARNAVSAYYDADTRAQEIFARIRNGETLPGVQEKDGIFSYSCADAENRKLMVEIEKTENSWRIMRWQVETRQIDIDDSLPVWDGR